MIHQGTTLDRIDMDRSRLYGSRTDCRIFAGHNEL